jgi:hypothetical protein
MPLKHANPVPGQARSLPEEMREPAGPALRIG